MYKKETTFFKSVLCDVKKETLAQVFSCEFWENFKNSFFTEHIRGTSSVLLKLHRWDVLNLIRKNDYKSF